MKYKAFIVTSLFVGGVVITTAVSAQTQRQNNTQTQRNTNTVVVTQTQHNTQSTSPVPTDVQGRYPTITIPPFPSAMPTGVAGRILDTLKERFSTSVERRKTSLEEVIAKINANPHLTEEQKAKITAKLEAVLKKLETTEISGQRQSTDRGLRSLSQQLNQSGVYSCEIPAAHLTGAINSLENAKVRLTELVVRVEALITQLESEGQDVARLKEAVERLNDRISNVEEQLEEAKEELAETENTSTQACLQHMGRVRSELAQANAQLLQSRGEIQRLKAEFQRLNAPTPSVVPTSTQN